MNWLLIIVGAIILIGAINGFAKGALRILVSLVTTIATIVIVFYATPYVSQAIRSLTPVDEVLESQCYETISKLGENKNTGTGLSELQVRAMLAGAGISEKKLNEAGVTVEDIINGKVSNETLSELGISAEIFAGHAEGLDKDINIFSEELSRNSQVKIIESIGLPDALKDVVLSNNNNEVYKVLGAETFLDYLVKYLTKLMIDIAAFLITFIIVAIVIRAIVFALDFVAEIPVLGILNRLSGVVVGVSLSLIIVWFIFVLITLMYGTEIGKSLMHLIVQNEYLIKLYEVNPIIKIMTVLR